MRLDRRFAVVLAVSVVWALIVSAVFYRLAGGSAGRVRAAAEKPIVLASRPLPMGAVIERDSVKLGKVPEALFPAGAFSRIEEVLERPVISPIQPEEAVVEARLAARGSGLGLGPLIPPGMRAIAVRVNDVVGVAGFILPGMRVDVLVTGRAPNSNDTATRTVLQNIAVLSVGQTIQTDGKSQSISAPVVTLLVAPQEAEALTLGNTEGHIQLVLRNSTDQRATATAGRQWRDLYGAPPPAAVAAPAERAVASAPSAPAVHRRAPESRVPRPVAIAAPAPAPDRVILIHGHTATVAEFPREGTAR
jgi:pilus assembly protein CpaB